MNSSHNHEPSYVPLLHEGVLAQRVEALEKLLESCTVCPRDCLNNRLKNEIAACYSGRLPIVSSYTAHFGEEPPLVGTKAPETFSLETVICVASIARTIKSHKHTKSSLRTKLRMSDSPK